MRIRPTDREALSKRKKKNAFVLFSQVGMNRAQFVSSVEELGLCDPDLDLKQAT